MEYRTNGSVAYDSYIFQESTARPLESPERLPQAPARPRPKKRPKAKLEVSPFALVGGAAALLLLFLVIFSYMRLYEAQSVVSALKNEEAALLQEQERLTAQFERSLDLDWVETRARQLGMREALPGQIKYVEIRTGDTTQVYESTEERNLLQRAWHAFDSVFTDLVEYFS